MIDCSDLWSVGADVLQELGFRYWKIFYMDEEVEIMLECQLVSGISWNVRFNLVLGDGRFLILRLRLIGEQMIDSFVVRENVKIAFVNRICYDYL